MKLVYMDRAGWFKMPRRCLTDPLINRDPEYLAVATTLLASAAFEPTQVMFGSSYITLRPGQLVTTRAQIAELSGVHESKVQRVLRSFEKAGLISQQTGRQNRLITLAAWLAEPEQHSDSRRTADEQRSDSRRPASEQQANTIKEDKKKENKTSFSGEPKAFDSPPLITLPLNDGTSFPVGQSSVDHWTALYPGVDVVQELRKMQGWCEANPERRKTSHGISRFITNWLAKEQDRGSKRARISSQDWANYENEHIV